MFSSDVKAQYYITNAALSTKDSGGCNSPIVGVRTNAYTPGLTIKSYYGHGKITLRNVLDGGTYGYVDSPSNFASPGVFTVKHVLLKAGMPVDSVISSPEYFYCNTMVIKCFYDVLGTGVYDKKADSWIAAVLELQVSHNGVVIDTMTITSGVYFAIKGYLGDIYSFRIISVPPGLSVISPGAGVIYDTVKAKPYEYHEKYFGFKCTGTSKADVRIFTSFRAGIHHFGGHIFVSNLSCDPVPATLTMQLSSRYNSSLSFTPVPASVVGNLVTWNFSSLYGAPNTTTVISADMESTSPFRPKFGDTLMTSYKVTPKPIDIDTTDNIVIRVDTVRAGYDPNDVSVSPSGYIPSAATKLTYTIHFENTGNDTAFNVSVYDTISPNINLKTFKLLMASHPMNIAVIDNMGENVFKFDFPNINLLDSTHRNECQGMVVFTVDTKGGLSNGTTIDNRAGIYFDYNDVVMTNTAWNIVGIPTGVASMNMVVSPQLYPNPADNVLTIRAEASAFSNITVTNAIGQVVLTYAIDANQTQVNVKEFPAGIYYVSVRGEGGVKTLRFEKL